MFRKIKFPIKMIIRANPKNPDRFIKDIEKKYKIRLASANWDVDIFNNDIVFINFEYLSNNLNYLLKLGKILKRRPCISEIYLEQVTIK